MSLRGPGDRGHLRHPHPVRWPCGFGVLGAAGRVTPSTGAIRDRGHIPKPRRHMGCPVSPWPPAPVVFLGDQPPAWGGRSRWPQSGTGALPAAGQCQPPPRLGWQCHAICSARLASLRPPPGHRASCHAAQPSLALPAGIFPWGEERGGGAGSHPALPRCTKGLCSPCQNRSWGGPQERWHVPRAAGTSPKPLALAPCPRTHCPGPPSAPAPPRLTPPPELGLGPVPPSHQCWGIH